MKPASEDIKFLHPAFSILIWICEIEVGEVEVVAGFANKVNNQPINKLHLCKRILLGTTVTLSYR